MSFKTIFAVLMFVFLFVGCESIKYPACENDTHCKGKNKERPNEVCVNQVCQECRTNAECADGLICKENKCEPECTTDANCSDGKICKEQKCQFECDEKTSCAEGYECKSNKCEVKLECTQDGDCDASLECRDNKCQQRLTKIAQTVEVPECTVEKVHFDFNEAILTEEAKSVLQKNVDCINQKNEAITIEGHADERGTDEYNLNLGQKRANSVEKYMKTLGIKVNTKTVSKGEEEPIDSSSTEDAWAKNRRSEIK